MKTRMMHIFTILLAMAFSCQKEPSVVCDPSSDRLEISAQIISGKTTTASNYSSSWENGDQLSVILKDSTSTTSWGWGSAPAAAFTYSSQSQKFSCASELPDGNYTICALYNGNRSAQDFRFSGGSHALCKIESIQQQNAGAGNELNMVYLSDALAGKSSLTVPGAACSMKMYHLFPLLRVSLVNETGASIKVQSLSLKLNTPICGDYAIDFSSSKPTASYYGSGCDSVKVVLNSEQTVISGSSLDFVFVTGPVSSYSGKLTLRAQSADGTTYTKSVDANNLSFVAGTTNPTAFRVTASDKPQYSKYSGELKEGDYILTYSYNKTLYALSNTLTGERLSSEAVNLSNGVITDPSSSVVWHIASDGSYWTIRNIGNGKYAGGTGVKNKADLLDAVSDYARWTCSGSSTYDFTNKGNAAASVNATLRFNSGYSYFSCYSTSTGGALTLYASGKSSDVQGGGDTGGGNEKPAAGGWLSLYEIPACETSLTDGQTYSSKVQETHGSSYAYVVETKSATQKIVTHTFMDSSKEKRTYTLLFDRDKKCALWAAFAMHKTEFPDNDVSRNDDWEYDPAIPQAWQASIRTGAYAGYSRGHQVASEDRQTTVEQNQQSFYLSNMTPQVQGLNGGVWAKLESDVQTLGYSTSGRDTLYVVTGPIFESGYGTTTDKASVACPIPSKYYKCIMKCSFDTNGTVTSAVAAAYLFDHSTTATRQEKTVDQIEALTGFDFFANVPKTIQDAAEASCYKFF